MSPEEFARIQEHFLCLRELDSAERSRRLDTLEDSAERGAAELKLAPLEDPSSSLPVLKDLLDANVTEDSPFDQPLAHLPGANVRGRANDAAADMGSAGDTTQELHDAAALGTPHSIGPYRILQKIGEGGHGLVFMAEQRTPIQRKVAIKLIKPGMESKTILARFEAERQALAMMRHPSIANVIDAGTSESGSPFFVMELVHGIPIDRFCQENRLDVQELLRLFQQVCDAVHHAHRKGIIHRDIKPANVLVTVDSGKPLAKVIDFGIAKAMHLSLTDKTMFTEYGQIVGTLEYMSPEQALMSQDVADVRSDVYSLGALLYVLLTGSPPISRDQLLERGIFELSKMMSDVRPPTPSLRLTARSAAKSWREQTEVERKTWSNHLRGDLDWITMKALAKELDQRYDSVADLSSDIECFLRREKIQARPPSLVYTVSKWVRRHQFAAIAAASLLCAGIVSFTAVAWGYYQSQENLGGVRAANKVIEEKAKELSDSLFEVRKERKRADEAARQLAVMLKSELLESAWDNALSGDSVASLEQLERVATEDRDYAWRLVDSVRSQLDWPSLRTEDSGSIRQLATHDETSTVAVITTESELELWDLNSLVCTKSFALPPAIYSSLTFSYAGDLLLLGASDWVQQIDLKSGRLGKRFVHTRGGTREAAFNARRGSWVFITGANFLLEVDSETTQLKQAVGLPERVSLVRVSLDGEMAAAGSLSGSVFVIDLVDGSLASTLTQPSDDVNDLIWMEHELLGVDGRGQLTTWLIPSRDDLPESISGQSIARDLAAGASLASDPYTLAVLGPEASVVVERSSQVVLLEVDTAGNVDRVPVRRFSPAIAGLHWLPTSGLLVVEHANGRVNLISSEDIECRRNYATQLGGLNDGLCLAESNTSVTAHRDGRLIAWDTQTGIPTAIRTLESTEIFSIDAFEGSGRLVSYSDDWSIRVADIDSLKEVWSASTRYGVRAVSISNRGEMIAGAPSKISQEFVREGTFDLWDMGTGDSRVQCVGHTNWVLQFLFDSQDATVYSLSVDGTIRRWETESGLPSLVIDFANESPVSVIGLLEDAGRLICGHQDGSLSLRSLEDGRLVASTPMLTNAVGGLIVCNDERLVIACTDSESSLTCVDSSDLRVVAAWNPRVGAIKGIRCDRSKSRLQILGEGVARILELPPVQE
ncbi:MAG: protein kinase [Pirellulaceae bacterium]